VVRFIIPSPITSRTSLNFLINVLLFLTLAAITGMGFLMKYVLIPGEEQWMKYGRPVDLSFAGMDRHEWGTIHLYIGLLFLALLALHIFLHWKMILTMFERIIRAPRIRKALTIIFIFLVICFLSFPLVISPEITESDRGKGKNITRKELQHYDITR